MECLKRKGWFSRLKNKSRYYNVVRSTRLFGKFNSSYLSDHPDWSLGIVVLARNAKEAAMKAQKRGYGMDSANFTRTTRNWGKWAVKPLNKPDHFRHIIYLD